MRITPGEGIVHVALHGDLGDWARSSRPHGLVLVDYDSDNTIIGITFAGPLAAKVLHNGPINALTHAQSDEIIEHVVVHEDDLKPYDADELDLLGHTLKSIAEHLIPA